MMEFMSTGELILLGVLTLMSIVMITFPKEAKFPFVGAFVLSMIMVITYSTHSIHLDKEFVLKRFQEGQAIECGLLRGERTLINPKSGWTYLPDTGFIKGDQIQNDPSLCNVMGEEAPEPSTIPYAFALMVELMLFFALRAVVQKQLNEEEDNNESDHE
ncbi:MAG: hypothetical protein B7Y17_06820 [Sulfuricurvum sp. 24-42-5]|nr:MAG: hypothetical protein B7Y17_06820 [Sulfuricurvum sp. 24-42-5]